MRYKVYGIADRHEGKFFRVKGLIDSIGKDQLLIVRYDAGDCDTRLKSKEDMHSALYDLYQTNEVLAEGDEFETEFGLFTCRGIHVVEA